MGRPGKFQQGRDVRTTPQNVEVPSGTTCVERVISEKSEKIRGGDSGREWKRIGFMFRCGQSELQT